MVWQEFLSYDSDDIGYNDSDNGVWIDLNKVDL